MVKVQKNKPFDNLTDKNKTKLVIPKTNNILPNKLITKVKFILN